MIHRYTNDSWVKRIRTWLASLEEKNCNKWSKRHRKKTIKMNRKNIGFSCNHEQNFHFKRNGTQCNRTKQSLYTWHSTIRSIFKWNGYDDKPREKTFHFVCRASNKIKYALCVLQVALWLLFNAVSGFEVSLCVYVSAGAYLQNRCSIVFYMPSSVYSFLLCGNFQCHCHYPCCRLVFLFRLLFIEFVMCVILLLLLVL